MANRSTRLRCRRLIPAQGDRQSLQKSLKRSGAISVYLTVCWMFLCPRYCCNARVSWPSLASLKPQINQPLDLALGEIPSFNCQVYDAWRAFPGCRFHADKPCLRAPYCLAYVPFLHSLTARTAAGSASGSTEGAARAGVRGRCRAGGWGWVAPPRGGGTRENRNFIQAPSPKTCSETISGGEEGCWRGNGVACFWATSLEKIFGGMIAIISFRPGGWMQQSAVPRCAILSVGSTGGIGQ